MAEESGSKKKIAVVVAGLKSFFSPEFEAHAAASGGIKSPAIVGKAKDDPLFEDWVEIICDGPYCNRTSKIPPESAAQLTPGKIALCSEQCAKDYAEVHKL